MSSSSTGRTRDVGWEIGVRRTVAISAADAWELVVTHPGLGIWLGQDSDFTPEVGYRFRTVEGTSGEIRSVSEGRLIRLTWQSSETESDSTVQVRIIPAKTGTTIGFHHERLRSADAREVMSTHWRHVLDELRVLAANGYA